jgi:hypothetical protein
VHAMPKAGFVCYANWEADEGCHASAGKTDI